jgi:hypothetical protein
MILEYIEHLREQPVPVRKRFTLFFSVGVTGLIVLVWLSILIAGRVQHPAESADASAGSLFDPTTGSEQNGTLEGFRASAAAFMSAPGPGASAAPQPETVPDVSAGSVPPEAASFGADATTPTQPAPQGTDTGTVEDPNGSTFFKQILLEAQP